MLASVVGPPVATLLMSLLAAAPSGGTSGGHATRLAAVTTIPAPRGLEAKLVADARDGALDTMGLLEAALIASGVADDAVALEARRVREALAPAIARARQKRTAAERGDTLLRALHETIFRRYAATATEVDLVAPTGEYNCLSSALLYVVAAEGLLDKPRAMVTRHHAYARVTADGRVVDVETTTPAGFDADRKKLMTPEYVRKIAGRGTSPAELLEDLRHPEELPVLSLVAGIYSNRAVALTQRGDLQGAAVTLDRAARLAAGGLKSRAAAWRGGVLNAGAIELVEQDRLEDARALLELALDGSGGETRRLLTANLATVHLKMAEASVAQKDWVRVLSQLDRASELGALKKDWGQLRARANAELAALEGSDRRCRAERAPPGTPAAREAAVCLANLARTLRDQDVDRALQHARRAYALAGHGPHAEPQAPRALFYTLAAKARSESDRGRCEAVESLVHEAVPHQAALDGQAWSGGEVMGGCWAQLADKAFDDKDWDAAARLYARARGHLPDDAALRGNLARVEVNRAIAIASEGRCDEARPIAHRAARADPALVEKSRALLESCAVVRARKAADAQDWPSAAAELRRGLRDAPSSGILKENLGTMLHNLAAAQLRAKRCDEARALAPELEALGKLEARDAVRRACP
jgi:tetratricopeptide (TPR) repeat protein